MSRLRMAAAAVLALVLAGCGTAAGTGSGASSSMGTIGSPTQQSLSAPSASMGTIGSPTQRSLSAPSPSSAPVTPAGNVLTAADTGARVTLVTGQQLTVDLAPGAGAYAWHQPRLTGSGLRLLSVTGGYPSHGLMRAVYLATGPGTAVLSSVSDMSCLHERPRCLVAQRLWTATVIIQAKPL